jgi:hypothetical protein
MVRTLAEDMEQFDALAGKLAGFDPPTIARAAFRLGLTVLEFDPGLIVAGVGPAKQRRAALKSRFSSEE